MTKGTDLEKSKEVDKLFQNHLHKKCESIIYQELYETRPSFPRDLYTSRGNTFRAKLNLEIIMCHRNVSTRTIQGVHPHLFSI